MFEPSRDEARQFFFETWRKYNAQEALTDLEALTLEVILKHPEYHPVLEQSERFIDHDYSPELGDINPFLHLGMHLAIAEQISIDQPSGIRGHYERLLKKTGSEHDAYHHIMECLAEMIWQAQRHHTAPDPAIYLDCLTNR